MNVGAYASHPDDENMWGTVTCQVGAVQRVLVPGNCTLVRRDNQKHFASQGPISLFFKKEKKKEKKKRWQYHPDMAIQLVLMSERTSQKVICI